MSSSDQAPLRTALLAELAAHPEGVSLPRLCKRLGVRMSVLLRELAWLGDGDIGGIHAEGLVQVSSEGERQVARLTGLGHEADGSG
ncbi:hypothetical protein E2F46_07655 [Luteimonas aestuarii]|uniref:ArsR family transcriptional regulator n=1 Tax=Luteimonas aestuarii TaxID=453837 RepID=A0A4R5TVB1_9GAMM|nr:hypothetical protein [Luteimonas aestuarii]TDK25035.1 hypothetical protein E2F46_07655 [Luteimonas aestuarii]